MPHCNTSRAGLSRPQAVKAYAQCVKMRKKINQELIPLMRATVSTLNNLNRSIEIVARELAKSEKPEDV